jgi:HSP20 family molecular chaperone IbpA
MRHKQTFAESKIDKDKITADPNDGVLILTLMKSKEATLRRISLS